MLESGRHTPYAVRREVLPDSADSGSTLNQTAEHRYVSSLPDLPGHFVPLLAISGELDDAVMRPELAGAGVGRSEFIADGRRW